jgi:hypothetical protein
MRQSIYHLLVCILALLFPSISHARQRVGTGIFISGGLGSGSASVAYPNASQIADSCDCVVPAGATTNNTLAAGIGLRLPLPSIDERTSLMVRLSLVQSQLEWVTRDPDGAVLLPGETDPVAMVMETRLGYTVRDIGFESLLLFSPIGNLDLGIGANIYHRDIVDFKHAKYIIEPEQAHFEEKWNRTGFRIEDNGHTLVYSNGIDRDFNPLAIQAIGSLLYTLVIDESMAIIPELDYRIDLVAPSSGSDWRWHIISGLISFRYSF